MGFLSRRHSRKGPQLALKGESACLSRVGAGFLSNYDGDLRDRLVGPQGGAVSKRVARDPLGFLCIRCPGPGPYQELSPELKVSSRAQKGMSGIFLSCFKFVKNLFGAQDGRWDFSGDAAVEKELSSC